MTGNNTRRRISKGSRPNFQIDFKIRKSSCCGSFVHVCCVHLTPCVLPRTHQHPCHWLYAQTLTVPTSFQKALRTSAPDSENCHIWRYHAVAINSPVCCNVSPCGVLQVHVYVGVSSVSVLNSEGSDRILSRKQAPNMQRNAVRTPHHQHVSCN
jgi:hypothetical protein